MKCSSEFENSYWIIKSGIRRIFMGTGNKNLCFDKARKFTNFFKESSIILLRLDPQDVSNIPLQKVAFICWTSATTHNVLIENFKTCLSLLSHRLQLNTPTETCWQLQQLLTFYLFGSLLLSRFNEWNFNFHCSTQVTSKLTIFSENEYM